MYYTFIFAILLLK